MVEDVCKFSNFEQKFTYHYSLTSTLAKTMATFTPPSKRRKTVFRDNNDRNHCSCNQPQYGECRTKSFRHVSFTKTPAILHKLFGFDVDDVSCWIQVDRQIPSCSVGSMLPGATTLKKMLKHATKTTGTVTAALVLQTMGGDNDTVTVEWLFDRFVSLLLSGSTHHTESKVQNAAMKHAKHVMWSFTHIQVI